MTIPVNGPKTDETFFDRRDKFIINNGVLLNVSIKNLQIENSIECRLS